MPINPITVTRLKTFSLMGHSNADGWAPLTAMIASPDNRHLTSRASKNWRSSPFVSEDYYENCYVATSAQPFPSPSGTPQTTTPGQVAWLELTTANTASPNDPHPHSSPYDYPNNRGSCYPRWYYTNYPSGYSGNFYSTPADTSHRGTHCGLEIPFMWLWRHYWGEQVGMVKMAFSSSFLMAADSTQVAGNVATGWLGSYTPTLPSSVDAANYPYYAYWTPDEKFDWAPGTKRIYQMWFDKMVGAAAALPTGTKMDVQCVIPWMGDNSALSGTQNKLKGFEDTMRSLINRIRADLVANDWTTLPIDQIPIVIPSVHPGYPSDYDSSFDSVAFCNAALDNIAKDDPYVTIVSSSGWSVITTEGTDNFNNIPNGLNHFGAAGYVQAAEDIMDAWVNMMVDPFDAFDLDEAITVSEVKRRVRLYYGRSKNATDLDDDLLLLHINAALQHCINQLGDNAWWLRRISDIYLDSGPNTAVTMPRYVHRLMKIEDPSDLEYPLRFEQLGHVDGGKLQILMNERSKGTYKCHFITMPKQLTMDDERVPCPVNIAEWLVTEVCARLAGSSSNAAMAGYFAGESRKLEDSARRSVSQTQRTKRDRMKTTRRYPILGYRRTHYQLWANDNSR